MYIGCILYMSHRSSKENRNATVYSMNHIKKKKKKEKERERERM